MASDFREKVRYVLSKHGLFDYLGSEIEEYKGNITEAIAYDVGRKLNFPNFRKSVRVRLWPYTSERGADYREILDEFSRDLHM